jgi:uncharacterized membrane protein YfcA
MSSPLVRALDFLKDFGFFEVILPFLLVFTLVFAILEKTKLFGEENVKGEKYPRKNIDAMIAFVIAFFVIAATNVVGIIKEAMPKISLILVILISFMLLAGSFMGDKQFNFEENKVFKWFLILVIFVGILLIFLSSIKPEGSNESWLETFWNYISSGYESGPIIGTVILIIFLVVIIGYVVGFKTEKGGST